MTISSATDNLGNDDYLNQNILQLTPRLAQQYNYALLQTATNNFHPRNEIGRGGFGSVYKAVLNDGTLVAIKVMSPKSKQGELEFLKEIELLSGIDHVNIVKLYGSCNEAHHRILVYEYLANNSLSRTLFGTDNNKHQFTWEIRSQICIGVALGLAFLHKEAKPQIVHRDIKPSNILLDQNFTPKISDFGLAMLFPKFSRTHIISSVVGTLGYIAPEYIKSGTLTRKSDVYSYGVLLLEIVSGRRNGDMRLPSDEQYLLATAWELYKKGMLVQLVDARLENCTIEACKYLKIGLLCTQKGAKKRPNMCDVAKMLKGEIDVDKMKMPKPGKLMTYFASQSSSYQSYASLVGSCFCSGRTTN